MFLTRRFAGKTGARPPKKKLAGRLILFGLGLLLLFWFLLSLKGVIYRNIARVETLQTGQLTEQITVSALLIKQEYLINAPLKGYMNYSVSDGQRVKAGTSCGVLEAPSMDTISGLKQYAVTTPAGGVFCNHIDGWETILVPGHLDVVDMPPLDKIDNNRPMTTGGNVEKGAPIAKVIDNLTPIFLAGELEAENFNKLKQLKDAEIKLDWQDQLVRAKIDMLENKGEKKAFVLVLKNYPDEILHFRIISFQIITGEIAGLLVREEALVSKDNKEGLYIIWKGLVRWVPVKIIKTLNGQAAIEGVDLQPGMSYVVNPRFVREGDRL